MTKNNEFSTVVNQYLQNMAEHDEAFAEKFANKEKSIVKCCDYIVNQARKQAVKSAAIVQDDVVFGWAAHYYQETNEDLANEGKEKAQDAKPKEDKVACTVSISKPTKLAKKQEKSKYIELDLFGGTL
jgi:hypothetical protein